MCRMRVASSALLTRNVVSRNHSSGSAPGGGCSSCTWTTHSATGSSPGQGSGTCWSQRHVGDPLRPAVLAGLLLAFTRALSRCTSTLTAPRPARCAPYRTDRVRPSARRASFPCRGRGRPWRGPAGRPAGQPPCSTNRSRKSASRSITHTTRVSDNCSAACAQSRSPSIQRNDLRSSRGFGVGSPSASGFGGAGARRRPAARPTPPRRD